MRKKDVLERIEKARRENATGLDLSGQGLTSVPAELAQLTKLKVLELHNNQLTSMPPEIGQLTNLDELYLNNNQLTHVPAELAQLTNLKALFLDKNQLDSVPAELAQLTNLQRLDLDANQLARVPAELGQLTKLRTLWLSLNQLTSVPAELAQLTNLQQLMLDNNQLTSIPAELAQLTNLLALHLHGNQLTSVPAELAQLTNLEVLVLYGNPLNPALKSAYEAGLDELKAYLRSLQKPEKLEQLYEAKLVLVGEGGVGKTTLLKAMMKREGEEPKKGEKTTHGVEIDIKSLELEHPEKKDRKIQLNAWDFGGQEVYKVTHQFFFSKRSVYLLVWEPRKGAQQCQVEDWLRLIRLRVGEEARIIIVSTHCKTGQRIARIDEPVLRRDFGSVIVGFHEVDSLVEDEGAGEKVGVVELKGLIAETAKDLEQMGMEFNRDWKEARDELIKLGEEKPRVSYSEFASVCDYHGLDSKDTKTLARLMHDLGYIVYYGEDERLKDDVVLQPEWLTKAIGFVLEDRKTQEMDGILPDERLKEVWHEHSFEGEPKYDPSLYPFFLRLMEKFDVSYRLKYGSEGETDASLVAQHVPQVRPALPWLPDEEPGEDMLRIGMVCVMDDNPPGLVPWMIVRTHPYAYEQRAANGEIHRLHWQKGMFLRNRQHGSAMLELRGREFHTYAEAIWPVFFMNVIQRTLHKLITDNWPGMEDRYYFAVPCKEMRDGEQCEGRFDIAALRQFLMEGDKTIRCQVCRKKQDIVGLLYGFEEEDSREQLARMEKKLDRGFEDMKKEFVGLESRIANYILVIMQAVASESKDGPRLFTVEPVDGNWRKLVEKQYRLSLWCEAEGCQHPVNVCEEGKGVYTFKATRDWVKKLSPYANLVAGILKTVLPVAGPAANVFFKKDIINKLGIKDHLDLMKETTKTLLEGEIKIEDSSRLRKGLLSEPERSGVLALHGFLRKEDPNHERLGLKRVPTYTGDYLWLCEKHYHEFQP